MHAHPRLSHDMPTQIVQMLPDVRVTRSRLFAWFVVGLVQVGRVNLRAIAGVVAHGCHPLSSERRLRRFLANPAIRVADLWHPLMRATVPRVAGDEVVLIFDPTPYRDRATVLMLSLIVHRRSLPLSWRVVPQQHKWDQTLAAHLRSMVAETVSWFPADCPVTVLLDRGLVGPAVVDTFRAAGWLVVLRLRSHPQDALQVRINDGVPHRIADLITGPGQRFAQPCALFATAGGRTGWLTIYWAHGADEPLVLFSDRCGGRARVNEYRKRMRVEAIYQDFKGRGFRLEQCRVLDLERINRLLAVVGLATWWLHGFGQSLIKAGFRPRYDRPDRRDLSVIHLARIVLTDWSRIGKTLPPPFRQAQSGPVFRWKS